MRSLAYVLGLVAGFGLTVQVGMNSQLRKVLQNANSAALISFLVGTVALVAILIATRSPLPARETLAAVPLWAWFGGIFGAFYVASSTVVAAELGTASPAGAGAVRSARHGAGHRPLWMAGAAGASDHLDAALRAWCLLGFGVWLITR